MRRNMATGRARSCSIFGQRDDPHRRRGFRAGARAARRHSDMDNASARVTGFEIEPMSKRDFPRVDVTLHISGLFRDMFPGLIGLFTTP